MLTCEAGLLRKARREGYAIPAVNTQGGNYDIIWAVCRAAEEMGSPVMLAHYVSTGAYSGSDWFVQVAKWCAAKVSVPVFIHLDHGDSFETCMEALRLGFSSVMIDGSALPVRENARLTQKVVEAAHCFGVPVEAEFGELLRLDGDGAPQGNRSIAQPGQVREFLEGCQPDTLAVGIGNAHGYYPGEPNIRLDVLERVSRVSGVPLVLHGCTGMSGEAIREAIRLGVAKINFGTGIRYKYVGYVDEAIHKLDHGGHSWKISQYASDRLAQDIREIITLSGSAGKA